MVHKACATDAKQCFLQMSEALKCFSHIGTSNISEELTSKMPQTRTRSLLIFQMDTNPKEAVTVSCISAGNEIYVWTSKTCFSAVKKKGKNVGLRVG